MAFETLVASRADGQAAGMSSSVTEHGSAGPGAAHAHFVHRLAVETDADDVAAALTAGNVDFILVDARSPEAYAAAHLPGAISMPHRTIDAQTVAALPEGLLVVYCWGPACNAAVKGAARLTRHGRRAKEMLGGFEYWVREGHPVEGDAVEDGRFVRDDSGLVGLPAIIGCGC
jgi:rhodanese-related sulfurtransferase